MQISNNKSSLWAMRLGAILVLLYIALGVFWRTMSVWDILLGLLGVASLVYVGYVLWYFLTQHVQRDILLVHKSYWWHTLLFVLAIPLAISAILLIGYGSHSPLYVQEMPIDNVDATIDVTPIDSPKAPSMLWTVYFQFIDAGNQQMADNRWLAALVSIIGLFLFNGLLVSTIVSWMDQRKEQWQNGAIRYALSQLPKHQFAVVIGTNEIAASVIHNLLKNKDRSPMPNDFCKHENRMVILQTTTNPASVRDELAAHLSPEELERVIIYNARRDVADEIQLLHLEYATEIYLLGENTTIDGTESYHDSMNMRCLNLIASYLKLIRENDEEHYTRKVCRVLYDYQTTCSVFQFSDLSEDIRNTLVFIPFNRNETWARKVLVDCKATDHGRTIEYMPLDGYDGIKYEDDTRVHLVIVGMSKMGIALGIQAMHQVHYPNYIRDKRLKTRITFIDTCADKEMAFFKGRFPALFQLVRQRFFDLHTSKKNELIADSNWIDPMEQDDCPWLHLSENKSNFIDVELEFLKGELESDGVREYLRQVANSEQPTKLTIAICLTRTHQAVAASLYMPLEVYNSPHLQQIWVYQREAADIINNLSDEIVQNTSIRYQKLRPFGMLYGDYMDDRRRYLKAMLTNMAYDTMVGNGGVKTPWPIDMMDNNDTSRMQAAKGWYRIELNKKMSNQYFVDYIYSKLRSVMCFTPEEAVCGFQNPIYDNPHWLQQTANAMHKYAHVLAQCEHNRWNMEKLLVGFSPIDEYCDRQLQQMVKDGVSVKAFKNELKSSPINVHPNICDFEHLDKIDPGAKDYDAMLNDAIPYILTLVDGYHTHAHYSYVGERIQQIVNTPHR